MTEWEARQFNQRINDALNKLDIGSVLYVETDPDGDDAATTISIRLFSAPSAEKLVSLIEAAQPTHGTGPIACASKATFDDVRDAATDNASAVAWPTAR